MLMTKRNKPSVRIVIGNVRAIKMGFTKAFNNARTKATNTDVVASEIVTPGNSLAAKYAATAIIMMRRSSPINVDFVIKIRSNYG